MSFFLGEVNVQLCKGYAFLIYSIIIERIIIYRIYGFKSPLTKYAFLAFYLNINKREKKIISIVLSISTEKTNHYLGFNIIFSCSSSRLFIVRRKWLCHNYMSTTIYSSRRSESIKYIFFFIIISTISISINNEKQTVEYKI